MYELIIANKNYSSWSMRPWVLMRAVDIPFTERLLPFHLNHGAGDFRRFSPTGRVPCLVDGELRIWDSLAITEYLAERHAQVWPPAAAARAFARSAAAEMHSGFGALRSHCSVNIGLRLRLRTQPPELGKDLSRLQELWAEGLSRFGGPWLAGDRFTAADAFYAPVATRVQTWNLEVDATSRGYAERLLAHPAVKEWIDAGVRETFRDEGHDRECLAHAELLQDLRSR
ncbi:MAG: glutathione S-transferase family protein [Steroidobacteraceae bacterium]